jgi:hypothetical protein
MNVAPLARGGCGFTVTFAGGVFFEGRSHDFNMMFQFSRTWHIYVRKDSIKKRWFDVSLRYKDKGRWREPVMAPAAVGGLFGADS